MSIVLPLAPVPMDGVLPFHTDQRDFTFHFSYKLMVDQRDGIPKIFTKSHNQKQPYMMLDGDLKKCSPGWHLFNHTGLPHGHFRKSLLEKDEYLVSIRAASEIIIALSNKNNIYKFKPTDKKRPIVWKKKIGQPFRTTIKINKDFRCWAFAVSLGDDLGKKTSQIHPLELTQYYEDAIGQKHGSGFCATIYAVSKCGRIIYFTDSGMPGGSFQSAFLSPLDGQCQIQDISAAGSTVIVSVLDQNNNLRIFTRHIDYESECPPSFDFKILENPDHQYRHNHHPEQPHRHRLGDGVRYLPDDQWFEQNIASIRDLISCKVSIHLIGQGEKARELRVLAKDQNGSIGFYHRKIYERDWHFFKLNSNHNLPRYIFPYKFKESLKKNYSGFIKYKGLVIKLNLYNFHIYNTIAEPSIFELVYNNQVIRFKLHTGDGWAINYLPPELEELIGSHDGVAKCLVGTFVKSKDTVLESHNFFHKIARELLGKYFGQANSLVLIADNQTIKLRAKDGDLDLFLCRQLSTSEIRESYYMQQALNYNLHRQPMNIQDCKNLLTLCKSTRDKLEVENHRLARKHLFFYTNYQIARGLRHVIVPLARAFFMTHTDNHRIPKHKMGNQVLKDVRYLFRANAEICLDAALAENTGYSNAMAVLDRRIEELEVLSKPDTRIRCS